MVVIAAPFSSPSLSCFSSPASSDFLDPVFMVLSPGGALWRPRVLPEFLCGASDRMLPVPDLLSLTFCALQGIKAPYTEALSNNKGAVVGLKLNKLVSDDTTEMAKNGKISLSTLDQVGLCNMRHRRLVQQSIPLKHPPHKKATNSS